MLLLYRCFLQLFLPSDFFPVFKWCVELFWSLSILSELLFYQDKDAKISFLRKAIDAVVMVTGEPLSVKPERVVAGHEPEKTNEFLQAIGKCCLNKVGHYHMYFVHIVIYYQGLFVINFIDIHLLFLVTQDTHWVTTIIKTDRWYMTLIRVWARSPFKYVLDILVLLMYTVFYFSPYLLVI